MASGSSSPPCAASGRLLDGGAVTVADSNGDGVLGFHELGARGDGN
jgi:hypothetical protein